MRECHILRPELFALVAPLRRMLKGRAGATMTLADQGVDLLLEGVKVEGLEATEAMVAFAQAQRLARLALDDGYGPQTLWEPEPVTITLSGVPVALAASAPSSRRRRKGEAALVAAMREAVGEARLVADLFAGLGTFALALAGKVYAAEGARDAVLALKAARGGPRRLRRSSRSLPPPARRRRAEPLRGGDARSAARRGEGAGAKSGRVPRCPGSLTYPAIPTPSRATRSC